MYICTYIYTVVGCILRQNLVALNSIFSFPLCVFILVFSCSRALFAFLRRPFWPSDASCLSWTTRCSGNGSASEMERGNRKEAEEEGASCISFNCQLFVLGAIALHFFASSLAKLARNSFTLRLLPSLSPTLSLFPSLATRKSCEVN